ncbi:MAG TPA: hypothetical protein VGL66_08410 [Caulobacteraceae bacterium]|jgi:hypothetical protein
MSVSSEPAGGTFDIGRVIQRTFGVIGRNFVPFLILALLFKAVPTVVIGAWSAIERSSALVANNPFGAFTGQNVLIGLVSTIVSIISVFVLQAALLRGTIADLNGKRASLGDMLSTGLRFFFPLLGLGLVMGVALAVGFLLLIVPGIMMAVAWCAAAPAVVAEKTGVFDSFTRSANLTRGHRWAIFGLFVIYAVIVISAIGSAFMFANLNDIRTMLTISVVIQAVVGTLSALIGGAGSAALYYELRTIKEGAGADNLASVFD